MDSGTGETSESNIQVFVRIRPPDTEEPSYSRVVEVSPSETKIILKQGNTPRAFSFDYVADVNTRQETIFNALGKKVIENCVAGYNGTIFAYGQTGSGKTFTMLGPSESTDNFQDGLRGVIPRSFEHLFSLIKREKETHGENKQFLCKCSFLEIYNEQIFDLLEPSDRVLHLRESLKTGVYVSGLAEQVVYNASEAFQLLNDSWINRRVASTSMNRESSRSHAVFTLFVESKEIKGGSECIKTSQLNLVDLAGSESQKNTNATGLRLKEAGSINKSLSNLGNVIMSLVSNKAHVPYRDSKLTFLLKASLGGNSKTSLIACVHSGHKYYAETLSTLQFATRAKLIKNKAVMNENAQVNIDQLQLVIKKLKEELAQYQSGAVIPQQISSVSTEQTPAEPLPVLKKMFLKAMSFLQKAEIREMELEKEIAEHKKTADRIIQQKVMIIKFREDALKRYDEKRKGKDIPDKTVELLQEEIKMLKEENTHHPLVTKYSSELQKLRKELQKVKSSEDWLARVESNHEVAQSLEQKYKELITEQKAAEDEPLTTPQRNDMISTATLEKLRSQTRDLENENNMLKQSLNDTKEELEQKVTKLTCEIERYMKETKDLKTVITAKDTQNKIEKQQMTEKHLQVVTTISTPKKERYKLRNRTVIASHSDSPLDISIPFEDPAMADEGIIGEKAPEDVFEQANEAFCEQIKEQQSTISNLEMRISEYDNDRIHQTQTISMLESRLKQMDEVVEKERTKELTARQKLTELERKMKDNQEKMMCDSEEITDLRMVLKSADNELKELKQKYKALEASQISDKETLNTELKKLERTVEQTEKKNEELFYNNESLMNELEIKKCNEAFHADLCSQLEESIKQMTDKLQTTEEKLQEERLIHENQSSQLSSEGMQKEQLYLDQCAINERLQKELTDFKTKLEKSRDAEELARRMSRQAEDKINEQFIRIQSASDKHVELEQTIDGLTEELETVRLWEEQNQQKISQMQTEIELMTGNHLIERQKLDTKMEMLEEDLVALQSLNDDYKSQVTNLEKDVLETKTENLQLTEAIIEKWEQAVKKQHLEVSSVKKQQENRGGDVESSLRKLSQKEYDENKRKHTLIVSLQRSCESETKEQRKEQSNIELSTKELEYEHASLKINELADIVLKRQAENETLMSSIEAFRQEKEDVLKEMDELKFQNQEHLNRLTEIANKEKEEKLKLEADLEKHQNLFKSILTLICDGQDLDVSEVDFFQARIQTFLQEFEKLREENSSLIGHSNHRQKIKYHEQVKNENIQLKKDITVWQGKYRQLHEEMVRKGMHPREKSTLVERNKENVTPAPRLFLSGDYSKPKKL